MARIYWKVEQGTADWFRLRCGIPTASEFDKIMTPKQRKPAEARHKYACRLIAQRLLNWQPESLDTIKHIEDGRAHEPIAMGQLQILLTQDLVEARQAGELSQAQYDAAVKARQMRAVGFVTTEDGRFGASPDRAIGGHPDAPNGIETGSLDITIEAKSPTIPVQMEYLLLDDQTPYVCQRQGQLLVADADKAIFYSFCPRMPPCHVETGRDEAFIRALRDCLERFSDELEALTEKARSLGVYQAFTELRTPLDQEYGENLRRAPMETEEELAEIIEGAAGDRLAWGG